MTTESRPRIATERRTFEEVLADFPAKQVHAAQLVSHLKGIATIPGGAAILEIGSGGGGLVIALNQLGYRCKGVEPWQAARANATKLAEHLGVSVDIVDGTAENLPLRDGEFAVVLADSVLEHVKDIDRVCSEVFRVLKPGGVFWFCTASSMCPRQGEIRGFPLFGWYPDSLKRRIMEWAKLRKPHLVGYTETPAIHWFTFGKAKKLLSRSGFKQIYDRWDIRARAEVGDVKGLIVRLICASRITRTLAYVCTQDFYCAAVK